MDKHSEQDTDFLLNAPPEVLIDWYRSVHASDHLYAIDLLRQRVGMLSDMYMELAIETRMALGEMKDSQEVLSRFTLKA